ncbi:hypothetical protein HY469_02315 [Candidatus Roizmanbacteria bacterium]|nr:hypothetical protein [Candidatus Roizmanbacteria bacterium]
MAEDINSQSEHDIEQKVRQQQEDQRAKERKMLGEHLGPERLASFESALSQMTEAMRRRILLTESQPDVDRRLGAIHEFSNALYARTASVNLSPDPWMDVAIEGATALLVPEALHEFTPKAQGMATALKRRYSTISTDK